MGKTSKPLHIHIDETLYIAHKQRWDDLIAQGYTIEPVLSPGPDLYLAPYAMRMTVDMLNQLPTAFDLAVKGARALRYPVTPKGAWKGANAQNTRTRKRKDTTIKVEAPLPGQLNLDPREPPIEGTSEGIGGSTVSSTCETTNNEGTHATHSE